MTWCDYAACHNPAQHRADGWAFCTPHLRAHQQDGRADDRAEQALDFAARRRLAAYRRGQIARLWRKGWNDTQIGRSLGITRNHVGMIRRSLGLPGHVRVAACGTRAGAQRHRDRKEPLCDGCRRADREYDTAYKRMRRQRSAA